MWVSEAKQRCPQLLILPYEFEAYASAAEDMYRAVLALTPHVMGISCDECYADATGCGEPAAMASQLRAAIARATGVHLAAPSLPRVTSPACHAWLHLPWPLYHTLPTARCRLHGFRGHRAQPAARPAGDTACHAGLTLTLT